MAEAVRPRCMGAAPWIACTNLKTTVDHYRELLGFDGDYHWFWGDPPHHAAVSRGRTRLLFVEDGNRAARSRGAEVVIYVKGIAVMYDELRSSGARIVQELGERPWGTLDFTVEDPDRFRLAFTEAPDEW